MMRPARSTKRKPVTVRILGRLWALERCPFPLHLGLVVVPPPVPSAFALSVDGGPRQMVPVED